MSDADSYGDGGFYDIDEPETLEETLEEAINELRHSREELKMKERDFKTKWKEELRGLKIGRILEDDDDLNDDE